MMVGKSTDKKNGSDRARKETVTTASTGAKRARAAGGNADGGGNEDREERRGRKPAPVQMYPINVRFPVAMLPLVEQCISESPIEFATVADFVRRAVENELRRRGKVKKFAD